MSDKGVSLLSHFFRAFLILLLISLTGALWWYGVITNRLAARDLEFLQDHFSLSKPFAEAWLLQGNLAYYVDLDPQAAAARYRQAIMRRPLMIDAWMNLAKVELAGGHDDEALRILNAISPSIAHVSTWKWQELLLARDLGEEALFAAAFNFILKRLPLRRTEACFLAKGFWGDPQTVVSHVADENQVVFLTELMKAREEEAAVVLWRKMEAGPCPPHRTLRLEFCQFLLARGWLIEAKEVWATWRDDDKQTVYDGGFETEFTNKGFGWYSLGNPDVLVERATEDPFDGGYCLHLRFMGTKNINSGLIYQIVPVEPAKVYRLRFARKSKGLTSDQGVYLNISGYGCQGLNVKSNALLKRTPWDREEHTVMVPAGCEALLLQVMRNESLMFDNKIAGDYWLDEVDLFEWHAP